MYFIIEDDIEGTFMGHIHSGDLVNAEQMMRLCQEHDVVRAQCFATEEAALDWNDCH